MDEGIWRGSYERSSYLCFLIILLISNLIVFGHNVNADQPMNASLIVLGRSGSGISSTVKQLIGPIKTLIRPEGLSNNQLEEFCIPLNSGGNLKIVDVSGLVDGKTLQADDQVLSSLKAYIQDPLEGLNNNYPNLFLIVSTFDDSRFHGERSVFIKTLKLVEMLQKDLKGNTTSNTALLLTKFLTATPVMARRPQKKIKLFRQAISNFTSFPADHVEILVGENLPEEYDLKIENGYAKLPNKEFYPKNVFDKLIEVADRLGDRVGADSIMEFMNTSRSESGQIYSKFYPQDKTKVNNLSGFSDQIHQLATGIKSTEIASATQVAYKNLNSSDLQSMTELQFFLQMNNFQNRSQLPTTSNEKVRLFQKLGTSIPKLNLLKEAFDLEVPEYIDPLVVGHGFDVIKDESLLTSPLNLNFLKPSSIGYMIPDILNCSKLENATQVDYTFYSEDFSNYTQVRFQSLQFKNKSTFLANGSFEGVLKSGFNMKPIQSDYISLSATREIRVIKCELHNQIEPDFNEEFIKRMTELKSFDESNRDSVAEWKGFFDEYGTHIVTSGFGGGSIQGSLGGKSLPEIINSTDNIHKSLKELVNFGEFSDTDSATYRFFGGYRDPKLKDILKLDSNSSQALLKNWQDSLIYDPTMLQYDLNLIQISDLVKRFNYTLAEEMERNTQLILTGNLKHKRKSRRNKAQVPVVTDDAVPSTTSTYHSINSNTDEIQNAIQRQDSPTRDQNTHKPSTTPKSITYTNQQHRIPENSSNIIPSPTNDTFIHSTCSTLLNKFGSKQYPVGFGYHALKDVFLQKSPFQLKENGIPFNMEKYEIDSDYEAKADFPCVIKSFEEFYTRDDYVRARINTLFPASVTPRLNLSIFEGDIPPWVFIKKNFTRKRCWTADNRFYKQVRKPKKDFSTDNLLILAEDFENDVKSLPDLVTNSDCSIKIEWKKFFDTYGTHYVTMAFNGFSNQVNFTSSEVCTSLQECNNCVKYGPDSQPHSTKGYNLQRGMEFEKLSMLFLSNYRLKSKIDEAYFHLLSGKLNFYCDVSSKADPCCEILNEMQ